ncbi:MAG: hypothetical protein M1828_006882 [Chrysothrix sp. TS-e1954]|nr:MAG: hypothetical protein M1828_006882 [Chrysothrix sp. TS-e1954]
MHFTRTAFAASALITSTLAQTSTKCNPLSQTCQPDPALGKSATIDFTSASSDFSSDGNGISYNSNGLGLTVSGSGDAPTITSKWYIMFGRVSVNMKAAPGTGIVSSSVLQSDDLDEIDWEFLGSDSSQVQTNYFGKGVTGSYNRATTVSAPSSQSDYNTYTIDWTADQIVWQINGQTMRTLTPASSGGQYPQSPMQVKLGSWAGGDPSNAQGTIAWAGGPVNYAAGPFTMYVKSVEVTDYSTGSEYSYSGSSGTWESIKSNGGSIGSNSGSASQVDSSSAPATTTTSGDPVVFQGTHADSSSAYVTPSEYPWVSKPSMTTSALHAGTSVPGLPAGWTVSGSGSQAVSASAAPSTYQAPSSTASSVASSSAVGSYGSGSGAVGAGGAAIYPSTNGTAVITPAPSGTLATVASGYGSATSAPVYATNAASPLSGRLDLAAAALVAAGMLVL